MQTRNQSKPGPTSCQAHRHELPAKQLYYDDSEAAIDILLAMKCSARNEHHIVSFAIRENRSAAVSRNSSNASWSKGNMDVVLVVIVDRYFEVSCKPIVPNYDQLVFSDLLRAGARPCGHNVTQLTWGCSCSV